MNLWIALSGRIDCDCRENADGLPRAARRVPTLIIAGAHDEIPGDLH
jgi:hypothetical protein